MDLREVGDMVHRMAIRLAPGVVLATAIATIAFGAVGTNAAIAEASTSTPHGVIAGQLGFEGGAYPGGFHPTAGLVKFKGPQKVGPVKVPDSGNFTVHAVPGDYTLTGCSGTKNRQCGSPQQVIVKARKTSRVQVVWLLAP
jgi:hypothetical protein